MSLTRFVLTFLGLYKDLVRDTNDKRISTWSAGGNQNRFSSCFPGKESNPTTQCYVLLLIRSKTSMFPSIEVFLRI